MSAAPQPGSEEAPTDRLSLRRNFLALTFGRFLAALSMWVSLIVLAKLADDATTVGIYALAQAICLPIAEIARMGLRDIRASDMRSEFLFSDYFGLRVVASTVAFVCMVWAGFHKADSDLVLTVIVLYGVSRVLELLSDVIYGTFQAQERMDYTARSLCIKGPLSLGLLTLGYWATGSLAIALLGQIAAILAVLVFHDLPVGRRRSFVDPAPGETFWPRWDPGALSRLFLRALPLAFATVLAMIAVHLPRLAVEENLGLDALGYFAPILALAMAPTRLVHALGMAATARLATLHADGERARFVRLLAKLSLGAGAFGLVGLLLTARFGDPVLRVVYTADYVRYTDVLVVAVAAATLRFVGDVLQFGMIASRRFWWLTFQYGSVALAAVGACAMLIPTRGMLGAAEAVLIVSAVQVAVILIGLTRNLPVPQARPSSAARRPA